jgi:aspartate-semialdehyde dehydrogenase
MKQAYRVGIVGASSLLGQELVRVLEEHKFPVSRLVRFEADEEEPDLPVVDLSQHPETFAAEEGTAATELDLVFLASRRGELPASLRPVLEAARQGVAPAPAKTPRSVVIDLVEALGQPSGEERRGILRVPFLERIRQLTDGTGPLPDSRLFASPHPAAIVLSALLLRLAARFPLQSAVALIFFPASEMGSGAIEELQKQTVNSLSFQKIPRSIFGAQLAFNLLAQLGGKHATALTEIGSRIRRQLRQYLGARVPLPAVRLCQAPVFYSLAFSLYVETTQPAAPEALGAALAGEHIHVRRRTEPAPSQVEAAGVSNILVDTIAPDPDRTAGVWIWAAVDNLRLAAVNAVEIAESVRDRRRR